MVQVDLDAIKVSRLVVDRKTPSFWAPPRVSPPPRSRRRQSRRRVVFSLVPFQSTKKTKSSLRVRSKTVAKMYHRSSSSSSSLSLSLPLPLLLLSLFTLSLLPQSWEASLCVQSSSSSYLFTNFCITQYRLPEERLSSKESC